MATVATLLPNPIHLQRLARAIARRHSIVACDSWQGVTRACESGVVHVVVADLYAVDRDGFDRLRVLRNRFPRLALIAYVAFDPARVQDLFDAGRFGLEALVLADQDDSAERLLGIVEQADARTVATLVRRSLPAVHDNVRDALLLAVSRAADDLSPLELSRVLGISRRTLSLRLAHDGFPSPRALLTWGRLLVAGRLLEDGNRPADGIATSLHFPSGSAFRNTCQRYLCAAPGEIRSRGGATYVLQTFLSRHLGQTGQHATGRGLRIAI